MENNKIIKRYSLMMRKALFRNKPYEDFDKCAICRKELTYKNSKVTLITNDFLPACTCKNCTHKIHKIKHFLEKHYKNTVFANRLEYFKTLSRDFDLWVEVERNKYRELNQ